MWGSNHCYVMRHNHTDCHRSPYWKVKSNYTNRFRLFGTKLTQLISSTSTAIVVLYTQKIWGFPCKFSWKILCIIKCHSDRSRAHLAVSAEWVLFQTNESCLRKLSSPFTMGLYGSLYNCVIHVSLITSFQPPLGQGMRLTVWKNLIIWV